MQIRNFSYYIKQGVKYLFSRKYMAVASICILLSCLLIISNFWLIYNNINLNIKEIEKNNEIVAFVDETIKEDGLDAIKDNIVAIDNVSSVKFVSKQQAFEDYKKNFEDGETLFSGLDPNTTMRDSFVVKLKNIKLYSETKEKISDVENVAYVRSNEGTVEKLVKFSNIVYAIVLWLLIILITTSIFIIVNTIKIAKLLYSRHINIMKYVGATNWFIRWPFIVEGAGIGLISAVVAFFLQWYIYIYIFSALTKESTFIIRIAPFTQYSSTLFCGLIAIGVGIGVIGSGITIRKYLDV